MCHGVRLVYRERAIFFLDQEAISCSKGGGLNKKKCDIKIALLLANSFEDYARPDCFKLLYVAIYMLVGRKIPAPKKYP